MNANEMAELAYTQEPVRPLAGPPARRQDPYFYLTRPEMEQKIAWAKYNDQMQQHQEYMLTKDANESQIDDGCECKSACTKKGSPPYYKDSWCYVDSKCADGQDTLGSYIPGLNLLPNVPLKWKYCNPYRNRVAGGIGFYQPLPKNHPRMRGINIYPSHGLTQIYRNGLHTRLMNKQQH